MSTSAPDVRLRACFQDIRPRLDGLPTEALARKSGFLKRKPRKIPIPALTAALAALGAETHLTLERVVAAIRLAADETYTKQAFHERLTPAIAEFLTLVAAATRHGWTHRPLDFQLVKSAWRRSGRQSPGRRRFRLAASRRRSWPSG